MTTDRPALVPYPLNAVLAFLTKGTPLPDVAPPITILTISEGQWTTVHRVGYEEFGTILLELDDNEQPLRAYRKPEPRA
jgi:hypothetical protein